MVDLKAWKTPRQWALPIICLTLFSVGFANLARRGQGRRPPVNLESPEVRAKTSALELLGEEIDGDKVVLTFRNTTAKPIMAFEFWMGDGSQRAPSLTQDNLGSRAGAVQPGATFAFHIPLVKLRSSPSSGAAKPLVTLMCVVFSDSTFDGDLAVAGDVLARRRGQRDQLKRIRTLVRRAAKSNDSQEAWSALRSTIANLPEHPPDNEFPHYSSGLHFAKVWVDKSLGEIETGSGRLAELIRQRSAHELSEPDRKRSGLGLVLDDLDRRLDSLARGE